MKIKFLLSTVLVLTLTLAACAPQAAPTKKSVLPAAIPPVTTPTMAPTKTVNTSPTTTTKATAVPTNASAAGSSTAVAQERAATPSVGPALINDISVTDQMVKSGTVLISMVDAMKPGWVAIFTDTGGQPGKLLGYAAVPKGTSDDIKVTVDPNGVTSKMIAILLTDEGKIGTFEYPGADQPVRNAYVNENVMAIFNRLSSQ